MTDFAPPPAPDGTPTGTVKRSDFRPAPPARRRGRFPRWVAVVLGLGALAVAAGVVAQVTLTVRNGNLTLAAADATGRLHSAQLVSGMCLGSIGADAGPVVVVPCEEPHAAKVVSAYMFTSDDWPGDQAVAERALAYCAAQLAPGGPLEPVAAGKTWVAWVPSEGTWQHGDRSGLCIVKGD